MKRLKVNGQPIFLTITLYAIVMTMFVIWSSCGILDEIGCSGLILVWQISKIKYPDEFRQYSKNGIQACGCPASSGGYYVGITFLSGNIEYSQVCGKVTKLATQMNHYVLQAVIIINSY